MYKKTLHATILICLLSLNSFSVLASDNETIHVKKAIIASTVIAVGFFVPFVDGQSEVAKNHEQVKYVSFNRDLNLKINDCLEDRGALHWWPDFSMDGNGFVYQCGNKAIVRSFDWLSDECKNRYVELEKSCIERVKNNMQ